MSAHIIILTIATYIKKDYTNYQHIRIPKFSICGERVMPTLNKTHPGLRKKRETHATS
jgi:hypothetical protein